MEEPVEPIKEPVAELQTPAQPATCPECSKAYNPQKIFCNYCGYPVNGTQEQMAQYEMNKFELDYELDAARKHVLYGSIILYVFAALSAIGALFALFIPTEPSPGTDPATALFIIMAISTAIFAGLGLWSRKQPFIPFIIASIIFLLGVLGNVLSGNVNMPGLFIYLLCLFALIKGSINGYKAIQIKRKLHID
ncbi:MAG: hypothetical protein M0D57_19785 [Sphingobacteriales bacterium JAD_PAG50586_3]|nr:MAG: hypothetical protein M0D57_19785 [Sphingobacteriales bacterium JAD_PAG50586_3]